MDSKIGFLGFFAKKTKNLKSPKFTHFRFVFLVKFYTDRILLHILILICEFCYSS